MDAERTDKPRSFEMDPGPGAPVLNCQRDKALQVSGDID
jgi:hypothetical protein